MEHGRYLNDTSWCDPATEVAHIRLTYKYYSLGRPIKDVADEIQLLCKIKDQDYMRVRGNLLERLGWFIADGVWRHKKCESKMAEIV